MKRSAAVLLTAGCLATLFVACGKEDKPTEPVTGEPVDILFFSDPVGAFVYFDGDSVGQTRPENEAPLRLNGVEWGNHRYRFTKQGYKTWARDYRISNPNSPRRIDVELIRLVGIEVVTVPPGATVYLNEEQKGTTPLTIEDVEEGKTYRVRVTLVGYFAESGEVTGGDSFYRELLAEPAVTEILVAVVDDITSEFEAEPPFSLYDVRYTDESVSYQAYVEVRFEEPAADQFTLTVQVSWKPKPTETDPYPRERDVQTRNFLVDEGSQSFKLKFRNFDDNREYFLNTGTYFIRVKNGENLMAETQFEVG